MSEPRPYYSASAVRELDRLAIAGGIPGFDLMQRAAQAAFAALRGRWPQARHCIVCAGSGNNGGDGFVLAALAREAGLDSCIVLAADPARIRGDALLAYRLAQRHAVPVQPAAGFAGFASWSRRDAVIVDALLGTGLGGPPREPTAGLIAKMNASGLPVLALDLPSGLDSDSGAAPGQAVRADLTVTFIGRKLGLVLGHGPVLAGEVQYHALELPAALYDQVPVAAWF